MPSRLKQLKERDKRTSTPSDLLADLHVYILPVNKWIPFRRLARNHVIEETVSAGFVRVSPTSTLLELRTILTQQLDLDFPHFYVYIRSVGRNFTQVKKHQESILKVKHFLPPQAIEPEIHILEVSEDLIKKSGSVPNLLLSESDYSDHGALSALTGRLSYVGSETGEASRKSSRLLSSQILHVDPTRQGVQRFDQERIRSNGVGRIQDPDRISTQERNGIEPRIRTDGTSEDEDSLTGDSYNAEKRVEKPRSRSNQRTSPPKRKKAISDSRLNRDTQSSEEDYNLPKKASRSKSEAIGAPPSSNDLASANMRRATSLNVLHRPSHEVGEEDTDKLGLGYRDRSRQRIKTNRRSHGRSISVSAIEGSRPFTRNKGLNKSHPTEKMRSKSQGDHQGYAPHKWRLHREAKILEKEVTIRTRLMEELEAMREAQKAEEARRFEEELLQQEALEEANLKDRKESKSRTEILNLEGDIPIEMIEDDHSQCLKGEYTVPPDGVADNNPIIGRLIGEENEGFEITYELKFSDNDVDEYDEINSIFNGKNNREMGCKNIKEESVKLVVKERNNVNRKKDESNIVDGRVKEKINKTKKHKNDENDLSKNETKENKLKKHQKENKTDLEKEEEIKLKNEVNEPNIEKQYEKKQSAENNMNDIQEEDSINIEENLLTKGAWADEQNIQPTHLQNGELIDQRPQNNTENIHNNGISGNKKIRSSYHRKKRKPQSSFKKDRSVPRETLEVVTKEREDLEDNRSQLFNRARVLHEKILTIRERKRQKWWDDYNAARRKGVKLEERQANLRQELETLYRRVLGSLMKRQPLITGIRDEPSRKASYKISVIRLRHEISDLLRRVEAIDIKLQAELRLRQQAEREVKQLRSEVSRKKANVALSQSRAPLLRNIANIPDDILIRL
ncbi:UNVERIFIED_CONTAM: hypothetical protein RMT77_008070 [Armadillidium vulgare]